MMGITTRGDVGLDAPLLTSRQRRRTKVASVQCRRIGSTNLGRDGRKRGFGFLAIVGMIGEGPSHDEQTPLIHGHLRVVILLEARMRRAFLSGATPGRYSCTGRRREVLGSVGPVGAHPGDVPSCAPAPRAAPAWPPTPLARLPHAPGRELAAPLWPPPVAPGDPRAAPSPRAPPAHRVPLAGRFVH